MRTISRLAGILAGTALVAALAVPVAADSHEAMLPAAPAGMIAGVALLVAGILLASRRTAADRAR